MAIPLPEFSTDGRLHPRQTVETVEQQGSLPTGWVSYRDHLRQTALPAATDPPSSDRSRDPPPGPATVKPSPGGVSSDYSLLPPEARTTLQEAQQAIFSVAHRHTPVHQLLDEEIEHYRQAMRRGELAIPEMQQAIRTLEASREAYQLQTDDTVHWFIQNYFRIFEEPDFYLDTRMAYLRSLRKTTFAGHGLLTGKSARRLDSAEEPS